MSLTVPPELLERVERGENVSDDEFLTVVATSLPYAWKLLTTLRDKLNGQNAYADNTEAPTTEEERGQLLRFVGSDAMRGAAERKFGVRIAFQARTSASRTRSEIRMSLLKPEFPSSALRDC